MIKRGIMEVADVVVVNKADGPTEAAAKRAAAEFRAGLSLMKRRLPSWQPHVLAASAHTGHNLEQLTKAVQSFVAALGRSGELRKQRARQLQRVVALNMQVSGVLLCCCAAAHACCYAAVLLRMRAAGVARRACVLLWWPAWWRADAMCAAVLCMYGMLRMWQGGCVCSFGSEHTDSFRMAMAVLLPATRMCLAAACHQACHQASWLLPMLPAHRTCS
jgi:hypothetical protein